MVRSQMGMFDKIWLIEKVFQKNTRNKPANIITYVLGVLSQNFIK